jgi:UDP-N-acetylglucosamine 2-epimerase (non-hydrolysing)
MRIVNVFGARPNLIKIAPIVVEMHRYPDLEQVLVHTGQHYDDNMSEVFFRQLHIPQPDYNLGIGSGTHTWQTAQVMLALEPLLADLRPDLVLVVGDVNSTVAAALVAVKLHLPLAHVEAGLRSFDRTMPEEINRIVTDALASYLFTTERSANENLSREGIPQDRVHFVGNVMIDTLLRHRPYAEEIDISSSFGVTSRGYALLTLHRPANVDNPAVLDGILEAIGALQARIPVVFPAHPRTTKRLAELGFLERVRAMPGLHLLEPLGYLPFLGLMVQARMVLTDSGGIQEETTILGVPCLTLRENTERPVTILEGTNQLVGTNPRRIMEAAFSLLDDGSRDLERRPERWDGHAAERIVAILRRRGCGYEDMD